MSKRFFLLYTILCFLFPAVSTAGEIIAEWDFSKGELGWFGNSQVREFACNADGLKFESVGNDPWIEGPAIDLSEEKMIRVCLRMKSDANRGGQLFYGPSFSESMSIHFTVKNDNEWHDYSILLREKVGAGTRFRLDPARSKGQIAIAYIKVEAIEPIPELQFVKPLPVRKSSWEKYNIRSGPLEIIHYGKKWGNFSILVDNMEMGIGYGNELIGIVFKEGFEWLDLSEAKITVKKIRRGKEFVVRGAVEDKQGGQWKITRRFRSNIVDGTVEVETEVSVSEKRNVVRLPWVTLFLGFGTFGPSKHQGLFAGLEYLADEPSSSKADIEVLSYLRKVPDDIKIPFPLMAIEDGGRYVGLVWERSELLAAEFDSPDRIYNSGGHVMGLSGPGVGALRFENDLAGHSPITIEPDKPLSVRSMIIAGRGNSVTDAVKHYLNTAALPEPGEFGNGFSDAVKLMAHGWLDSAINEEWLFRHAVWGSSFGAGAAADAAMFMSWLSNNTDDKGLKERLREGYRETLGKLSAGDAYSSSVSHVVFPTGPLVFGRVDEYVEKRRLQAIQLLKEFDENGIKTYSPGKVDYSRTHFADHANGLSGRSVVKILEAATLTGDKELISEAIELLDKQTKLYSNTVPRGAQTWEVPLHTPDVLASAHMVKAYVLGYVITGREDLLEQSRYWAWTGVPFVYLDSPTEGETGDYAIIAVYGATNWNAPVWFGLPVQWCGLVYASSLYQLSEYDDSGPWEQIAKGITITGLNMSWPQSDKERVGLLPDIYDLRGGYRDGPAINPGTVGAHIGDAYGKGKMYDMKRLKKRGWFFHAPCSIRDLREDNDGVTMKFDGWGEKPYYVLISGLEEKPASIIARKAGEQDGQDISCDVEFFKKKGRIIIKLEGEKQLRLQGKNK
jgi:hypothetical protein